MQGSRVLRPSKSIIERRILSRNVSFFRPLDWVREKLAPAPRIAEDEEKIQAAKEHAKKEGMTNVFEDFAAVTPTSLPEEEETTQKVKDRKALLHKYSTANFKISHRKLNMLSNQIAGKPIDQAILQMQFSEKRASTRIMNMLATARDHASRYKNLDREKLVVSEAWVTKGKRPPKQIEPRGRGHHGTRSHPHSKMNVVLMEGKTVEERKAAVRKRKLDRIVSASMVRENKPIRNPSLAWTW